ncbi:MAG: DUF3365 domain-containing protein [Verrucomicrobia bacterium]|nr:DUF3365 domain-containing protein [Verrucomicrobiota bacterium]MBV9657250.1 DUF3365 domain-containing protein [Verrucomicrobiota bacterium]
MRLLLKFNLFFLPLLLLALGVCGYVVREALRRGAEQEVLQNARVMMETASAMRAYTSKQIAPLLEHEHFRVERAEDDLRVTFDQRLPAALGRASETLPDAAEKKALLEARDQVVEALRNRPREVPSAEFHPHSVPAYAATEVFNYFRSKYSDYAYKEATLNPTNLRDRTVDWEADVVNAFRQAPDKADLVGRRDTPTGASLFLGAPLRVTDRSCLVCHSTPDKAPAEMIKIYGDRNGFGWKENEIIGAQIVSVPEAVPVAIAEKAFRTIGLWLAGIFGAVFVLSNLAVLGSLHRRHRQPADAPA